MQTLAGGLATSLALSSPARVVAASLALSSLHKRELRLFPTIYLGLTDHPREQASWDDVVKTMAIDGGGDTMAAASKRV